MKRIYTIIYIIALAVLCAGCAKELQNPEDLQSLITVDEQTGEQVLTITLSVPESDETKTSLGSKSGSSYPVYWGASDVITLNGTAAQTYKKDSNTQATATFKVDGLAAPFNFLYQGVPGQGNQVTFPANQSYVAGGFDPAAMPMYASVADVNSNITFRHVGALLKFSFTGSKKIDSVTLTAADSDKSLSGTFTIGADGSGILNGILTPAATGAALSYNFGGHMQLTETPFVFYVAIPAGTYEGGINLVIVDNDGGHMNVTVMDTNATKTIAAGKVREFDNVTYIQAKENNLKLIWSAATFQEFVTAVANGNKTLNARLTPSAASIDLSSIAGSFSSIEDYKGTFDGNGKTLSGLTKPMFNDLLGVVKNLTLNSNISITSTDRLWGIFANQVTPSLEVDDVPGLQNCTAKGSITWAPSDVITNFMALGGLVGNNRGGSITGCTNDATVTFASSGVTHTNQPSVGGVVGRTQKGGDLKTQGEISNCTNNGTVVCAAQFSQGAYIGGVLGYQVEKAETMSGCVNHGLVKATSTFSTGGALHIAGVAGLAKGTVENCTNSADGTVTTEACSVSSYLCQGGVVGRLNGTATYSTLTNAGTLNVAAVGGSSGRLIGGVVGRCDEGATLDGVTNSGNINYTAVDDNETWIGGIVASNTTSGISLENCQSTGGTLTYSGATTDGALYVGGVVGYSTKDITSCSNAMTLNITGTMSCTNNTYKGFGGIVGHMTGANIAVTNCTNSGAINYGQTITDEGQLYVGGLVGVLTKGEISGGGNSGTFTFTGQDTKRTPSIGGVVGRVMSNDTESGYALSNNVTNSGAIVLNSSVSSSQYLYVGGLVGQHAAGNIYGTNSGSITVTEAHAAVAALGGLVGYMQGGAIVSGSANTATGDITLNGWQITYHSYVGGIAGLLGTAVNPFASGGGTITGASNAGDITFGSGSSVTRDNFIGGVVGYAGNTVSSSSNSGNIVNNFDQTAAADGGSAAIKDLCIGGVAGVSDAAISSCYNTGNVTNNGSTYNVEINVGGVVGIVKSGNLTSCSNGTNSLAGGTISNTATSGTSTRSDMQVGGVIGNNKGGNTITSCFNKGEVTNSGAGAKISMGGLAGWSSASTTYETTCYNMGTLTNTGTGSSNPGLCMGGLLGVARGANTLTGTASVYNYNKGLLRDDSATLKVALGGVCGYSDNAASNFNYCQSQVPDGDDVDDIIIQNQTKDKIYVGGILGMSAVASSIDYTYSESDIWFSDLTMSAKGQIFAGGIIGGWTASGTQTITGCTNKGWVYTASSGTSDLDDINVGETKTPLWSCFGGIAGMGASSSKEGLDGGWNTITGKTFTNCTNTGRIRIYCRVRFCIGGVVAYSENNISNCTCTADIYGYTNGGIGTVGDNYHRNIIGGVVGLFTGSTISSSKFQGTLNSYGSSPFAYDGGIIGYTYKYNSEGTSITLSGCKVGGGTIRGAGSGQGRCALMVNNSANTVTYTFTDCVIKKSTVSYATGSKVTISSSSNVSEAQCFGGGSSSYTFNGTLPTVASSI